MSVKSKRVSKMRRKSKRVSKMRRKSKSFQKRKHTRQTRKRSQSCRKRVRFSLKGGCGCEMAGGKKQIQTGGLLQDLSHTITTTWNGFEGISNVHNPSPLPEAQGPLQL